MLNLRVTKRNVIGLSLFFWRHLDRFDLVDIGYDYHEVIEDNGEITRALGFRLTVLNINFRLILERQPINGVFTETSTEAS